MLVKEATAHNFCAGSPVYYGALALYVCGGSLIAGILRTANGIYRIIQLQLVLRDNDAMENAFHEHPDDKAVQTAEKCLKYKKSDAMAKFFLLEIARGISEIAFPVLAAVVWTINDLTYQRPSRDFPKDLAPATPHNLFGWDELKVLNTGASALRDVQKLIHADKGQAK